MGGGKEGYGGYESTKLTVKYSYFFQMKTWGVIESSIFFYLLCDWLHKTMLTATVVAFLGTKARVLRIFTPNFQEIPFFGTER